MWTLCIVVPLRMLEGYGSKTERKAVEIRALGHLKILQWLSKLAYWVPSDLDRVQRRTFSVDMF
jgi:hypothetical protein